MSRRMERQMLKRLQTETLCYARQPKTRPRKMKRRTMGLWKSGVSSRRQRTTDRVGISPRRDSSAAAVGIRSPVNSGKSKQR